MGPCAPIARGGPAARAPSRLLALLLLVLAIALQPSHVAGQGCGVPVGIAGGTVSPGVLDATFKNIDQLTDNVTTAQGTNLGTQTTSATTNYIQVQLEGGSVFSDIATIQIWAGITGTVASSRCLTVWLSSGTNFTATGTACVRCMNITAGSSASSVVTCPQVSGVGYVTIQRVDTAAASLVVHELQIFRSSGCRHSVCMIACVRTCPSFLCNAPCCRRHILCNASCRHTYSCLHGARRASVPYLYLPD